MNRNLTCIICPKGCTLSTHAEAGTVTVTGNFCPRGEKYTIQECLDPKRTVTATVHVSNRYHTMISVKTKTPVPKDRMFEVMAALRKISVKAPLHIGDVILDNICGSAVVVTKTIE